jgi:2-oxo-3-hexenedioate decarboxylase
MACATRPRRRECRSRSPPRRSSALTLAEEILDAYARKQSITAPSNRDGGIDVASAYTVESDIVRLRGAAGHRPVGLKVGFANRAMWRVLKLDTLVYGHMYDDTVHYAEGNQLSLPIGSMFAPKFEPEIVVKMKRALAAGESDPVQILDSVEWIALGFEVIDCVFPDWKFTAADFLASKGLHAGLVVGEPLRIDASNAAAIAEHLPGFTVSVRKNGEPVAEGSGKNSLKSPALCVGELAGALAKQNRALAAGDVISTGTLTEAQFVHAGETWSAVVQGLPLPVLTVRPV